MSIKHLIITGLLAVSGTMGVTATINAQSASVDFSGFIKTDAYMDTRETVAARDGHFMLFPMKKEYDSEGKDINDQRSLNIMSIQTRLTARITGPDAFGARTTGMVEGAFFGSTDANINTLRLRHAWVNLQWENTGLLVGQYWHPLFVPQSFPGTVSFSSGTPFQAFSRNPQIRLTHQMSSFSVILAAMSQRDFTGPGGTRSLQQSAIPNLHLQLQKKTGEVLKGAGADFKRLEIDPQQYGPVNGFSGFAFLHLPVGSITSKSYVIYAENLQDQLMIGGVAGENGGRGIYPIRILSAWQEFTTGFLGQPENIRYEFGVFTGFAKNLGTNHDDVVLIPGFARGGDIDHLYRISPRVQVQSGPARFAFEVDITTAAYGNVQNDGRVTDTTNVTNVRLLLASYLFF
ncbi:hypothetical protein QLX67_05550 [Balneolaceae bacterium ANBcel3]|nr:hypothetical protein [Balneolaceae bacterium ANBcel3]